jgi:hypothetical protein
MSQPPDPTPTTGFVTAPPGANIHEIRAGITAGRALISALQCILNELDDRLSRIEEAASGCAVPGNQTES